MKRTIEEQFQILDFKLEVASYVKGVDALMALDDQVRLMELRADYVWFGDQVAVLFPLGIRTWADEQLLRKYAAATDCSHIVDAFIDEHSLRSAGIELALLDRLLA